MLIRFFFVGIILPVLDAYVRLFVWAEKMYRKTSGSDRPGVPPHLRDIEEEINRENESSKF